ncbi:hypothetical protein PSAL_031960 [Pseudooceanicola algae]|uniref:Uncharacterized protein n=1 Tax=Pseudooceanicola algae TaxID=1537215 RepID=A0A418SJL7_9RHOB|nr:hypothetical protein PSAL_031960 [Pseudooceanicola algae]
MMPILRPLPTGKLREDDFYALGHPGPKALFRLVRKVLKLGRRSAPWSYRAP